MDIALTRDEVGILKSLNDTLKRLDEEKHGRHPKNAKTRLSNVEFDRKNEKPSRNALRHSRYWDVPRKYWRLT